MVVHAARRNDGLHAGGFLPPSVGWLPPTPASLPSEPTSPMGHGPWAMGHGHWSGLWTLPSKFHGAILLVVWNAPKPTLPSAVFDLDGVSARHHRADNFFKEVGHPIHRGSSDPCLTPVQAAWRASKIRSCAATWQLTLTSQPSQTR